MRFEAAPELFQVSLAREQERMRIANRNFAKTNSIARTQLSSDGEIDRDHVRDLWITANRLAIIQKHDRFAARRDLDRAGCHRFGKKIDIVSSLETRAVKSNSHSIGIRRNEKAVIVEELECCFGKATRIRA